MSVLVGSPSDETPEILATGGADVAVIYASFSSRHPDGLDAQYLEWHSLDHRPEQHRLSKLRASFRVVSTPDCRRARAASGDRYDAVDHLQTYLFSEVNGLDGFVELNNAMHAAGRTPYSLPLVERVGYGLVGMAASPRIKVGAEVLPWWPSTGLYLLIERGVEPGSELVDVPGVGGAWWGTGLALEPPAGTADTSGLQVTYCFLDEDPATVAERLRPLLAHRWSHSAVEPLLAAPFRGLVPYEWDRHLP